MINELYNGPFWIGLSVSIFAVLLSLTIFLIQVRPILEMQLRMVTTPYVAGSLQRSYILYCDVKNSGLTPVRYRIRSHSEKHEKTPAIFLIPNIGTYNDSVQMQPALNAIQFLEPGNNTYHVMGSFSFRACHPEDFDELLKCVSGETSLYAEVVNRKGHPSRLGKFLSRKMDVHFNALYADTAETRSTSEIINDPKLFQVVKPNDARNP